jgi:hypothetical protein
MSQNTETDKIINRVSSNNSLVSLDLAEILPKDKKAIVDLKDCLYEGLVLREKDFRQYCKNHDWSQYTDKHVAITCSADAIVPMWAYMLVATYLQPIATTVLYGNLIDIEKQLVQQAIDNLDLTPFKGKKIVIKGCSDLAVPEYAFTAITVKLLPVVNSIMYGEPCSTVPIFKQKSNV